MYILIRATGMVNWLDEGSVQINQVTECGRLGTYRSCLEQLKGEFFKHMHVNYVKMDTLKT